MLAAFRKGILLAGLGGACVLPAASPVDFLSGPLKELDVVRKALRDTMWDVAEQHAERVARREKEDLVSRQALLEVLAQRAAWPEVLEKALAWQAQSDHEAYHYWAAYAAFNMGRLEEARRLLDGARFRDPAFALLALRLRARMAAEEGDTVQAAINFRRAAEVTADPEVRADVLMEYAQLLRQQDPLAAYEALEKGGVFLATGVCSARARLMGAELLVAAGRSAAAEKTLRALVAQKAEIDAAVYAEAACACAALLEARGEHAQACVLADDAYAHAPTPALRRKAGFLYGFCAFRDPGTRAAGAARIRALVQEFPDAPETRLAQRRFADALLEAKMWGEAVAAYDLCFELEPAAVLDPLIQEKRAQALLGQGDLTGAAGVFALAAQKAETNAAVRARCLVRQGDALAAAAHWMEAALVYVSAQKWLSGDGLREATFRAADAFDRAGEPSRATPLYTDLAQKGDAHGLEAALRLAARTAASGRLMDAVGRYTPLVASSNAAIRVRALAGRGRAYYHVYQFDRAAADFRAAAEQDPGCAERMQFLLALCLYGERRETEALAAVRALQDTVTNVQLKADMGLWMAKYDYNAGNYAVAEKAFMDFAAKRPAEDARAADALLWAARSALARNAFTDAVQIAADAVKRSRESAAAQAARLVQAEALMELARYDDAVLVLDDLLALPERERERVFHRASLLKADALFARGADDTAYYRSAYEAYRAILSDGSTPPAYLLEAGFKAARALEKIGGAENLAEAARLYYVNVVQAFRAFREKGVWLDEAACAFFVRGAFVLVDYKLSRGDVQAAAQILKEVAASGTSAAEEARKRLKRLKKKGEVK